MACSSLAPVAGNRRVHGECGEVDADGDGPVPDAVAHLALLLIRLSLNRLRGNRNTFHASSGEADALVMVELGPAW